MANAKTSLHKILQSTNRDNESDISAKYSEFQGARSEEKMISQESSKHKALSDDVIKLEQSIDIEITLLKERLQSTDQQLIDLSVLSENLPKLNKDGVEAGMNAGVKWPIP